MAMAVSVADQIDRLDATTPDDRAAQFANVPIGYQAGLNPGDFAELAKVVEDARTDNLMRSLAG